MVMPMPRTGLIPNVVLQFTHGPCLVLEDVAQRGHLSNCRLVIIGRLILEVFLP
jgi:hypothetical protein